MTVSLNCLVAKSFAELKYLSMKRLKIRETPMSYTVTAFDLHF